MYKGLLKSWMPWRSEPAHVSRDFWMPDQSCRVCYECDSQFTLFNRRHHCRLCGRIFCAKCTSNWLPIGHSEPKISLEEWDKIRVCNYCFKQREKEQWGKQLIVAVDDGLQVDLQDASCTSPSATSFLSTRSSGTCGSSSTTFVSVPQSAAPSPMQSPSTEADLDRQNVGAAKINDVAVVTEEQNLSEDQFGYFQNRSDDDDDEYGMSQLGPIASDFSQVNGYYGPVKFEDINSDYNSRKVHPDGDAVDSKSTASSPLRYSVNSQHSEESQQIAEKDAEQDIGDECEAPSSLYVAEDVNTEPVDFENNGVLWLPPEPEDEEDEREALLFEDDGDGDAAGEWGYLNNSSSSGSGEFRSREKSNEEHKRAMKSVVEGHFRALVAQLLQVENLLSEDENDKESWLEIIIALSWEAATLLKPDMSQGGQMDPGGYVKVKCLASGLRSESLVVRGVVCKKNVAHRRMTSRVEKPRLLILGGALEYQRVSNALSSFDTLLQQEMDHLKMAVAKISVHTPNILLVEKSVSRYAQEYLLAKEISLVLNIKRPLLERIARCTGAQIVPSIDHLSSEKVGYCDMFNVMRFTEEHGSAGQAGKKLVKTLMYFEGCPKPQGCTIILRGASGDELKKVKHVVQYGVFAAYHLALETSFLADEGASLPALQLNSPITVALPDKQSTIDRSISTVPGFSVPSSDKTPGPQSVGDPQRSNTLPPSDLIRETIASIHEYAPLSSQYGEPLISSSVKGFQRSSSNPFSAEHGSEDQAILDLGLSSEAKPSELDGLAVSVDIHSSFFGDSNVKIMESDGSNIDTKSNASNLTSLQTDSLKLPDEQPALKEEFPPSPSDHQSILVSLSSRCVWKGTVCERSHLFRIKYYGSFDKPLGRFLRDHLFDQSFVCRSCEMPAEAHVQCYTHRQGTLTISVKKLPEIILPGERDGKIWMWHRCLRCPRANGYPPATRRVLMSDAAWGLSFGKFLELSFSNHAAASRVASCGHSLHRDCLRFYGFGQMVACFRYASIDVHSVYLPPSKLDFNYKNQEWIEKEMNEVVGRAELLFSEVLNALRHLAERKCGVGATNGGTNVNESRHLITDLEGLLQKEKSIFEEMLQKLLKKEVRIGQPLIDILELNQLRRELVFQSYVWDRRLIYAASLDSNNKPNKAAVSTSEAVQKPLGETERVLDVNVPAATVKTLSSSESIVTDTKLKENPDHGSGSLLNNHLEVVVPQITDLSSILDHGQNPLELSRSADEPDSLVPNVNVHSAFLDGQSPISLSDTLDAAWTGESHPGMGVPKKCSVSDLAELDTSSAVRVFDKSDMEEDREDSPSGSSTKSSGDADETENWLSTPFSIYYRSPSKNCSGPDLKLDVLGGYNPVYISLFQDPELQGGARLLLPMGVNETVIPVYDDEPTSLISYALVSHDYFSQISDEPDRPKDIAEPMISMHSLDVGAFPSLSSLDEVVLESYKSVGAGDEGILTTFRSSLNSDPVSYTKALHARVSFTDDGPLGKVKYTVTCYYAKRFDALRRISCPSEVDFVRSLSRCKKWGAQGGKSNVFFAKTLDDRFIIKQVTKTELESFIKFAPGYFKYLSESIGTGSPTCLAKILGIYQVSSKHLKGGKEMKMDVLVMENLLFGRNITRLYDLKGSSRSRYNPDSSGSNKVLLDQNLIEAMPTSPIFVGNKAKRVLERAVWNDTAFLASIDVMDYSLLVGVDEEKHELVLGIIDFMRQYTWDKHLETWVKASGILGGPKNASPTVISPKQYKRRFRKAMTTYFLMVPDQWSPPTIIRSQSQSEMAEENSAHNSMPSAE
ncbi:1-phosphatidylinositol-3-phosphate 5-kinase FAB1B-like isoform X2 [Salvia miltiorrhiza]|uniref:1-phosphatidylinositol-3-phosphate 5-kinase FAB1B-like isoform X2 n=1 Tax=Salvia miltiorrhiza TaxID=226208 RepID=UPI0025AD6210|nr:1-phosphatidylinositol-3-phosphate 5-kinase FAB1B-like isoform X2 [Salvia miltiorrhiza]